MSEKVPVQAEQIVGRIMNAGNAMRCKVGFDFRAAKPQQRSDEVPSFERPLPRDAPKPAHT